VVTVIDVCVARLSGLHGVLACRGVHRKAEEVDFVSSTASSYFGGGQGLEYAPELRVLHGALFYTLELGVLDIVIKSIVNISSSKSTYACS